jgi:hypothetical protein
LEARATAAASSRCQNGTRKSQDSPYFSSSAKPRSQHSSRIEPGAPGSMQSGDGAVTGFERMPRTSGKAACAAITSSASTVSNQACATIAPGKPCRACSWLIQRVSPTWFDRSHSASQWIVVSTLWPAASRR